MRFARLTAVAFAMTMAVTPSAAHAQGPLPLDPLTPREQALADTIARSNDRFRTFVASANAQRIGIDFVAPKGVGEARGADAPPRRHAEVLYYRYDVDSGMRALVDLQARRVVDIAMVPGQSVPIAVDEITRAARLALADRQVAALFGGRIPPFQVARGPATLAGRDSARIEGLRTVGATRDDPCFGRRCIVLFFRVNNQYVHMNRVTVDLTGQRVIVR